MSMSFNERSRNSRSRTSPLQMVILPATSSKGNSAISREVTVQPFSSRYRIKLMPRNPAPPVIKHLFVIKRSPLKKKDSMNGGFAVRARNYSRRIEVIKIDILRFKRNDVVQFRHQLCCVWRTATDINEAF